MSSTGEGTRMVTQAMKRAEKKVVVYTSACHGLTHILELTYAAVLVTVSLEFGLGLFALGMVANSAALAFGVGALPSGFLADRIGERRLLIYCFLGTGVASLVVGLSPSIWVLAAALTALGLTLGLYHPAGSAFIARVATKRGPAFGYLGAAGNLGVALGPIMAGGIAALLGWRASYFIFAIPAFFLVALLYSLAEVETAPPPRRPPQAESREITLRSALLPLVVIYLIFMFSGFIYRGALTFLPLYIMERVTQVDSTALAGSFTTVALLFGVGGQFLGGLLSQRMRREKCAVIVALVTAPALLAMGNLSGLVLVAAAALFAFFHFMAQPVYNYLIAEYSPPAWRGRSYGISFFCTFGLGSFSAGISGYIAEHLGVNWVFISLAGFDLLILACATFLLVKAPPRPGA